MLLFMGCDKIITLPIKDNEPKVVIEGFITDQPGPYFVKLSKSVNINETSNYPIINNAIITIADNTGRKDTLSNSNNGVYKTDRKSVV